MGKKKAHNIITRHLSSVTNNVLYAFTVYPGTGFLPLEFKNELICLYKYHSRLFFSGIFILIFL